MNGDGVFIALEGSDGAGKGTQFNLLKQRLEAVGYDVAAFDFPRYDEASSYFVKRYLNGDYGQSSDVNPYAASIFYAVDRYEAADGIRKALGEGKIVLSNRYAGSNMAHQGTKFTNEAEQRGFFMWADSLEFQLLGIPRPDLNIYLRVPADISYELIAKKAKRNYTDKKRDIHEADINHLRLAVQTFDLLCRLFPKDFRAIECSKNGNMLSIPDINNLIWKEIGPYLNSVPKHNPKAKVVYLSQSVPSSPASKSEIDGSSSDRIQIKLHDISLLASRYIASAISSNINPKTMFKNHYTPGFKNAKLASEYTSFMNEARARAELVAKLMKKSGINAKQKSYALQLITPLATYCDLVIQPTVVQMQALLKKLSESSIKELNSIASTLRNAAAAKWPNSFAKPIRQTRPPFQLNPELIQSLNSLRPYENETVNVSQVFPRNEFEVIADRLYSSGLLPHAEILGAIDKVTYEEKQNILNTSLNNSDDTLDIVSYEIEIILSGIVLNDLINMKLLVRPMLQPASPQLGYAFPDWTEGSSIEGLLLDAFDDSLQMYSKLQSAGYATEAQYLALNGHRLRLQTNISLGRILLLKDLAERTTNSEISEIHNSLTKAISEHHPLIGDWLAQTKKRSPNTKKRGQKTRQK